MSFFNLIKKLFGTKTEREVKRMRPLVERINELEPRIQALRDYEFASTLVSYRERHHNGESLERLLPEVFALVREASVRTTGMRHFDVQMIGGIVLHQGKIAEMKTGEGKTLVATLPLTLNSLADRGVHLVTVNDYLAKRDAEWMGKIYKFLGLSVGVITHDLKKNQRQENYRCDITYGTNNEFGFDYLRDNMEYKLEDFVQRDLYYAIVDEVDSILVDEARTPLIISGPKDEANDLYHQVDAIMPKLQKGRHYTIEEKSRTALLTDDGVERVQELLRVKNLFDPSNILLLHHATQGLRAHAVYKKDIDYLVQDSKVMIIDEFTGRALPGRRWSDGLHQAVEAKEKVRIEAESETLATISFQNFFRLYDKLAGMTGTAETEAAEFHKTYKMEVVVIPTNMSAIRIDHNDVVYRTEKEKFGAVLEDIAERHQSGQPILVGTISIEKSEILHKMLSRLKIPHNVLNAKHHAREAEIIAQAGREAAVTIATNMAGRGTDIILGGNPEPFIAEIISSKDGNPKSIEASIFIREMLKGNEREARQIAPEVADISDQEYTQINEMREKWVIEAQRVKEAGGLHIIGTERHDSRRIDNQLRGRSGRQGDPGSSRFYLSLEDDLMRRFGSEKLGVFMERIGMEHGEPIEHRFVTKAIENAQAKVEAHNFEIRKHMLEYDDVMNIQRKTIYGLRREILNVKEIEEKFFDMFEELLHVFIDRYCPPKTPVEDWDIDALENMLRKVFNLRTQIDDDKMLDSNNPIDTVFDLIWENVEEQYQMRKDALPSGLINQIMAEIYLYEIDENWKAHLTAIDHLREGVGLQGYRQIDPKLVYKREAFDMFQQLLITIHSKAVEKLFNLNIIIPEKHEPTADTMIIKPRRPRKIEMHHGSIDAEDAPLPEPTGPTTVRRERSKIGRNEPCWCGSGKKYKKCCAGKDQSENAAL